jgi:hypothetical protein
MSEAQGIIRSYEAAGMIAQAKNDPSVFDRLDDDKALSILSEVNGAPAEVLRADEAVAEIRKTRAAKMAQMEQLEMAKGMSEVARNAAPAIEQVPALREMAGGMTGGGGAA